MSTSYKRLDDLRISTMKITHLLLFISLSSCTQAFVLYQDCKSCPAGLKCSWMKSRKAYACLPYVKDGYQLCIDQSDCGSGSWCAPAGRFKGDFKLCIPVNSFQYVAPSMDPWAQDCVLSRIRAYQATTTNNNGKL